MSTTDSTQAGQDVDHEFDWIAKRGGPAVEWKTGVGHRRDAVVGDGLDGWHASASSSGRASLSKHGAIPAGYLMLELSVFGDASVVHWNSTLQVGDGRYVRVSGRDADFLKAKAAAEGYEHGSRQIGGLTWWRESEQSWVSWLGQFDLRAVRIESAGQEPYWHFAAEGNAATFEEAALLAALGRGLPSDPSGQ